MDLAALADTTNEDKLTLRLRVGAGDPATAPGRATQIDLGALTQLLLSGLVPQAAWGP
ncbi:hypothetical protein ACH4XT_40445 [Streptomyces avidinii]|uniref:hypothetical protein n=1 Tax=Streptomyces avidinii TaxID=1895 RepID=UPI0037B486AC